MSLIFPPKIIRVNLKSRASKSQKNMIGIFFSKNFTQTFSICVIQIRFQDTLEKGHTKNLELFRKNCHFFWFAIFHSFCYCCCSC